MPEIKNINTHARWLASYQEEQTRALIYCQEKKIKQLTDVIEKIKCDLDLRIDPRQESNDIILESIEALVSDIPEVKHIEGYFIWEG